MCWDGFLGQIIVNKRNLDPECQKVTPTEVKVDEPARARPGVTRTCEQYIIYLLLCAETESVVKSKVASVFKKLKIARYPGRRGDRDSGTGPARALPGVPGSSMTYPHARQGPGRQIGTF